MTVFKTDIFDLIKKPSFENAFKYFGDNPNGAIVVAVAIAGFKGIFRPLFTMMDKKSDTQTKKYTAMREFLTEMIAIPVYVAIPLLCKKIIVDRMPKSASEVTKKAATTNVKFWGVLAATAIIPAVCNLVQPPIMNRLKQKQETKKALLANNIVTTIDKSNKPSYPGNTPVPMISAFRNNSGMRVGS